MSRPLPAHRKPGDPPTLDSTPQGTPETLTFRPQSGRRPTAQAQPTAPGLGLGARSQLLQARGFLVVTGIAHGRRRLPQALHCSGRLLRLSVSEAEVVQGLALAVPVTGRPEDRHGLLAAVDGLIKPPQLPVGGA